MNYDAIVIGAGSAGLAFARAAAKMSKKVLVIEPNKLGGTCVNRGCVPKKYMWLAANLADNMQSAVGFGFNNINYDFDWAKLLEHRDSYITRINKFYENSLKDLNIDYEVGFASFVNNEQIQVNDKIYTAKHIVLATGMQPKMPDISGIEYAMNSDDFFLMDKKPESIIVVGAGYIAVEIASLMNSLGVKVKMICRGKQPLRNFDSDIQQKLADALQKNGVDILSNSNIAAIEKINDKLSCILQDGRDLMADKVLVAIGRKPMLTHIAIERTDIKLNSNSYVLVDENYKASPSSNLYALGDIIGEMSLTPVAIAQARRLADKLFGQDIINYHFENIPTVVFSHPCVASIGLSEQAAIESFGVDNIKVYSQEFTPMSMLGHDINSRNKSFYKMIVARDDTILGIHMIGDHSDEILQGFAVALNLGAKKLDFDQTIAIHPSSAEELVTMR